MSKRNGKIELLRFVFFVGVLLFHLNKDLYSSKLFFGEYLSFFSHGYIAVEFFFVLSGFFMAKSAMKSGSNGSIGSETVVFMKKKILSILPAHIICFAITFILVCILEKVNLQQFIINAVQSIPAFLFLNKTGISVKNIIPPEWYISCMLFALALLFPLCRKFKKTFTHIIAPAFAILFIGYFVHKYDALGVKDGWSVLMMKGQSRAIAEIALGASVYAISCKLKTLHFSRRQKVILTVFESLLFIAVMYYSVSRLKRSYDPIFLMAIMAMIALVMSDQTLLNGIFQNRFVFYLGKLSLPAYLVQTFTRRLVESYLSFLPAKIQVLVIFISTIALGALILEISKPVGRVINDKLDRLSRSRKTANKKQSGNAIRSNPDH